MIARRARFVVCALAFSCAPLAFVATPADASCVGPSFDVAQRAVRRGETVRVIGEHWGTQCFDAGVPSGARGTLGDPQINLTLTLVQEPRHVDVAVGDAAGNYGWLVDIAVPVDFAVGTASLEVFTPAPFPVYVSLVLQITDEPAVRGGPKADDVQVVVFGRGTPQPGTPAPPPEPTRSRIRVATVLPVAIVIVAAALLVRRVRGRM